MSGLQGSPVFNPFNPAASRNAGSNNQGPPHGTSPLMGPVTAQTYPYGQVTPQTNPYAVGAQTDSHRRLGPQTYPNGQAIVHPYSLSRAAIRATAALDNVLPIVEDAQNDAREQQRERHNTQLHLDDAELAAGTILAQMSRRAPLAPAHPVPEPATVQRVANLANEEPIPLSGRRMLASDIAGTVRMEQQGNSTAFFRDRIEDLNGYIDDYEKALEKCSIQKKEAERRLESEMEDWRDLRDAIVASDGPKRALVQAMSAVHLRLKKIGEKLPTMDLTPKAEERSPRRVALPFDPASRPKRPMPSRARRSLAPTSSPAPIKRQPSDLPPKVSTTAATPAQGRSVQQTLQAPTSIPTMQQQPDRPIAEPITPPQPPLDHGDQAQQAIPRMGQTLSLEGKLDLFYRMAGLDTEMVGDPREEAYRRDVFHEIFGEDATYFPPTDVPQVDDVPDEDITMRSDCSVSDMDIDDVSKVCDEDVSMGDIPSSPTDNLAFDPNTTRLDAPIDTGNAAVQNAPTPTPQNYPKQMEDEEWVIAPSEPPKGIKRSYKEHSFRGYREQDLQLSAGRLVKRVKPTIGARTIHGRRARNKANLTNGATLEMPVVSFPALFEPTPAVHVPAGEVQVVSSPAPCEPAPTEPVVVPSEAAFSVSTLSEPTLVVEEPTKSVMTEEEVREESGEGEAISTPFINEVSELSTPISSCPLSPTRSQFVPTVTEEVVGAPAPSEPALTESVLTLPTPTEEVVGTALMEQTPAESDLAEPVEANVIQSMPGSYPATLEELVLPWMWCSETVESAPAVIEPAPTVEEEVIKESSSNEEEPVAKEVNAVQEEMVRPRETVRPRQRRSNGISHLERILAMCPESNYDCSYEEPVASADSHTQNSERVRINVSPLVSTFSGPVPSVEDDAKGTDSCAGESKEKKAETAHSAQQVAEEQRASPEGSMDPTSDISPSETETTPGPAVNAANGHEVRSMGLALLNGLCTGLWMIGVMVSAMVVALCVFVLCGGHFDTFAHVMAGTEPVLEELRAGHGLEISFLDQIVYMVMCWFAGDRLLPG